jgi:RNA polymerase sigma-B factor
MAVTGEKSERDQLRLIRFWKTRDPAERDALVERYLPIARSVAARYRYTDEPFDDLLQVAAIGLLKAIDGFDPSRGFAFTTYAVPKIVGELRRYLRDHGWAVHMPRDLQELGRRAAAATDELEAALGRAPTIAELAMHLDISEERALDARQVMAARRPTSLDEPVSAGERGTVGDLVGVEDCGLAGAEAAALAAHYCEYLSPLQRRVLDLYFGADLTQREIGEIVSVSQMHVSRLIRRAVEQIRSVAAVEDADSLHGELSR